MQRIFESASSLEPHLSSLLTGENILFPSTDQGTSRAAETSTTDGKVQEIMAHVYFYLTGITSILSMFGCFVLVFTFIIFRELQTTGRKLLVCLSVADFLTAFGNLVGIIWYDRRDHMETVESKILCQFHASLTIFSSISSFLWSTSIGIHLFVCICLRNAKMADKLFWPFVVVCWTLPAIIAVISWVLDVLGHDPNSKGPSWCWIKPDVTIVTSLFWQYLTGKCWELASYFVTAIIYAFIKRRLNKQKVKREKMQTVTNEANKKRPNTSLIAEANRKLVFVPLIFVALRIWGTIRFIVGAHFSEVPGMSFALVWIVPLQGIGDSAQGLANFLLFCCFTKRVRQLCLRTCSFSRCRVHPRPSTPTLTRDQTPAESLPPNTEPVEGHHTSSPL